MLDILIIGGSAAGATAAIYAARAGVKAKIISVDWGGEVVQSGEIWNYPGFVHTTGIELSEQLQKHVAANNVEVELGVRVEGIEKLDNKTFIVTAKRNGEVVTYKAKAVIVATGVHPKSLSVPNEEQLRNRGVSYCTVCDGPLYRGKTVVTIGGGNSALESALLLSKIAPKVYVINKNTFFKGEAVYVEQVEKTENIEVIYNAKTTGILGTDRATGITYTDSEGKEHTIEAQGVFIHIGLLPNSVFVSDVEKNKNGEIIVDKSCMTSLEGLFAAGDVTDVTYNQIVIAAGQGAIAALSAIAYIQKNLKDIN